MSLKDLAGISNALSNESGVAHTTSQFPLEMEFEENVAREQYRVIKKDLLFKVNFQQINNRQFGENAVITERTLNDFRKLGTSLQKLFPGCFVPIIPKQ